MNDVTIEAGGKTIETNTDDLKRVAAAAGLPGTPDELKSFVDRIERLEEEKAAIAADITDVKKEAKEKGFCAKTIAAVVKRRLKDQQELFTEDRMLDTYLHALGMERG